MINITLESDRDQELARRKDLVDKQIDILKKNGIKVVGRRDMATMVLVSREDLEDASQYKIDGVKIGSMR